tara:strand:- start:1570 stop:2085 length:516 start_codon:yes stop_codon:yes gene_type:complete
MLGLSLSTTAGSTVQGGFKLVISTVQIVQKPDDESFTVRAFLSSETQAKVGTASLSSYNRYTNLTADLVMNRVDPSDASVQASATATLNVFRGAAASVIQLSDATANSSFAALLGNDGADTLDMTDTNVFSQDITTASTGQAFRADIVLKGTGFTDSDSVSSASNGTQIAP